MLKKAILPILIIAAIILSLMGSRLFTTIPAGHVGVGSVFGKVSDQTYDEGFHIISPFTKITKFDARQKSLKESMQVPSRDQLDTQFDVSIQYRLIREKAASMLKETGSPEDVVTIHMLPLLRSQVREAGKSVATAEEFYNQEVQQRIQTDLQKSLETGLTPKGIRVEQLLIRNIVLPSIITKAVQQKKIKAQEAERAKEEYKKFEIDQKRKAAQAEAEKKAELIEASKRKEVILINAQGQRDAALIEADKKKQELLINAQARLEAAQIDAQAILVKAKAEAQAKREVIGAMTLDGFLKIESMKALEKIQGGNHMIIMDSNTTNPLPFMNLNPNSK